MMNRFCKVVSSLLLLICVIAISGCQIWDEVMSDLREDKSDRDIAREKLAYQVSIHSIVKYPRGTKIEQEIPTIGNRKIWVNRNPFLHSRNIMEIKPVPSATKEGFYDLRVKLDRRGRKIWMMLSVQYRYQYLAFVIDGIFYRAIQPKDVTDEDTEWILIEGPFCKYTAMQLEKHAPGIYKFYYEDSHIDL